MKIAIRLEQNGSIYIDKKLRPEIDYAKPPYNFTIIEIDNQYADCEPSDFDQDLKFNIWKYAKKRQKMNIIDTKNKIVSLIREKYSIDDEMAILRQKDTKPNEFQVYNEFVEECKRKVKEDL